MTATYGSSRLKLAASDFSIATIAGTTTAASAGTWNIYLQAVNRAGGNLLSDSQSLSIVAGVGIEVTLNSSAIASGEDIFWLAVWGENTGNASDARRLAAWKARDNNQLTYRSLPATIQLTTDEHFELERLAATLGSLPQTDILDGAIARTLENANYYRYDSEVSVNNYGSLNSYGTIVEGSGNWVRYYGQFTPISDTESIGGSDLLLSAVGNTLKIPPKIESTNSTPLIFWINNGYQNDGSSPIINGCYTFVFKINGFDYSSNLSDKVRYKLLGYVDRATGVLDTNVSSVGDIKLWNSTSPVKLVDDLPRNYAASYEVFLTFTKEEFETIFPDGFQTIEINIIPVGQSQGKVSPLAGILGSLIFGGDYQLLVVPGLLRMRGFGTINIPGTNTGFIVDPDSDQPVPGLLANTANQRVVIAGSFRGIATIKQAGEALEYSQVDRAIVSTETGISNLSQVSSSVVANGGGIEVTVNHPVNGNSRGIIRADYPDRFLKGTELGEFTPTQGYVFLVEVNTGDIYQSPIEVVGTQQAQTYLYEDLSSFTIITALPTQSDPYFSLYEPVSLAIASVATGTINGEFEAYFGYYYPPTNIKATKIVIDDPSLIPTLNNTFGQLASQFDQMTDHLSDLDNPHQTNPEQIGAALQTDFENLVEIVNTQGQALQTLSNQVGQNLTAIAIFASFYANNNLDPLTLTQSDLPYTLKSSDRGKEIIIDGLTGQITIPDDVSGFDKGYQVLLSCGVPGDVLIEREDGNQTDLNFSNDKQRIKKKGEVTIRRRGTTNIFHISGILEN